MRRIPREFRFHVIFGLLMIAALLGSPFLGYNLGPN